mmetsp:Transcript_4841/g.16992  ORF Transcript_4841/g.16992 Transcript_4841/m.16992 type:complete len:208 (+) Transcript_4841:1197-1820(+)
MKDVVCDVQALRAREPAPVELVLHLVCGAKVDFAPLCQQKQQVELLEGLEAGLVKGRDDDPAIALLGELLEGSDDRARRRRVQSRGGFVQDHDLGVRDEAHADANPPSLAPADAADPARTTHLALRHVIDLQLLQHLVHLVDPAALLVVPRQLQLPAVQDALLHRQDRDELVRLWDVGRDVLVPFLALLAVNLHAAPHLGPVQVAIR